MTDAEAQLPERIAAADKAAVARALNLIEDRRPEAGARIRALLAALPPRVGGQRIGLTGPPGAGKSTLAAALAREWRARGCTAGILAVDPSSVRSGGALLGDRARMAFDPADAGLFVRSLATAGDTGGLAYAAALVVEVLACAYDRVLVETTGVGQSETDVEHVVDTVCVVVQPGSGDVLQFIKAGIMEIPDVLVVNKGDHGRLARRAANDLEAALEALRGTGVGGGSAWQVPVLVTSARDRTGIDTLADAFEAHRASLADPVARRRTGAAHWTLALFRRRHGEHAVDTLGGREAILRDVAVMLAQGAGPLAVSDALGERYFTTIART
jgi:LAO/AO transport system kinase